MNADELAVLESQKRVFDAFAKKLEEIESRIQKIEKRLNDLDRDRDHSDEVLSN